MLAYQAMPGAVLLSVPTLLVVWTPLATAAHLAMGLTMGVIGACSHFLLIHAFGCADAAVLAPLLYTESACRTQPSPQPQRRGCTRRSRATARAVARAPALSSAAAAH